MPAPTIPTFMRNSCSMTAPFYTPMAIRELT
jgi:hypothetical protein